MLSEHVTHVAGEVGPGLRQHADEVIEELTSSLRGPDR
jgi:hypothetical protein